MIPQNESLPHSLFAAQGAWYKSIDSSESSTRVVSRNLFIIKISMLLLFRTNTTLAFASQSVKVTRKYGCLSVNQIVSLLR